LNSWLLWGNPNIFQLKRFQIWRRWKNIPENIPYIHASHVHVRRAAIPADRTFVLILWLRCPSSTFSAFSASSFYSKEKPRARA
jgi:hypothetical protein